MIGFKKWLWQEEQKADDVAPTKNIRGKVVAPANAVTLDYPAVTPPNSATWEYPQKSDGGMVHYSFPYELISLLEPADPWLYDRQANGLVPQGFQGTLDYAPPEMAKRLNSFTPELDTEEDSVEQLLKACAYHFVWMDRSLSKVLKAWHAFRQTLQVGSPREGVNPVLYQVNIGRMKDCVKAFAAVDKAVQKCEDRKKWGDIIEKWKVFYQMWRAVEETLAHYLATFEKNSRKESERAYRSSERSHQ